MMKSEALECVRRSSALSYEEKPKMHKFYRFLGKVGTTSTTIVWIIDQETVSEGDNVRFIDEGFTHICPSNKFCYMKYLSEDCQGYIDKINDDGYIFVSKL